MTSATIATYGQTALGILVSVVLFLVGYRQTIGARKERVRNANSSLLRSILRRLVLERYEPTQIDLLRLIEGKAAEFQVRPADLAQPNQVLIELFTTVFDSDLIPVDKRIVIEDILRRALDGSARTEEIEETEVTTSDQVRPSYTSTLITLTLATALFGSFASLLPQVLRGQLLDQRMVLAALGVFVASLTFITGFLAVRRTKEEPVDLISSRGFGKGAELEARVAQTLDRAGLSYRAAVRTEGGEADFLVDTPRGLILLEVKAWPRAVPIGYLQRALQQVARLKAVFGAVEALIVVPDVSLIPLPILRNDTASLVTLKELSNRLKKVA